jgi:hypothetical protein
MASSVSQAKSHMTHYRRATVNGRKVFYREAGDPSSPTIVLLHGLPTSGQMSRELIPALAETLETNSKASWLQETLL